MSRKIRIPRRNYGRQPDEVKAAAIAKADADYIRELTGNVSEHPSLVEQKDAFGEVSPDQLRITMAQMGINIDA